MSLADDIRKKTTTARLNFSDFLEKDKHECEKIKKAAEIKYNYIYQLIEGAATHGADHIEYPTLWVDYYFELLREKAIYKIVCDILEKNGFRTVLLIQDQTSPKRRYRLSLFIEWDIKNSDVNSTNS